MNILLDGKPEEALRIQTYMLRGGYVGLKRALGMEPQQVIDEIKASGLRGRGGAGFPAGTKLGFIPKGDSIQKYIICNFDEGEPGTYKDRTLIECVPHKLVEGLAICAWAIGANQAFIYCRAEYVYLIDVLKTAIAQAKAAGLLEHVEINLRMGAGAYVCGEESALIESIEGHRGNPRFKPPYPAVEGLWKTPTVVMNVETLCTIPYTLRQGGAAFGAIGSPDYPGTKLIMLNGDVKNRGCYEVETGMSLRQIIEQYGGGMRREYPLKAMQIGGTSGGFLKASQIDTPLDFSSLQKAGGGLGSGAILVLDESRNMADRCLEIANFYRHESCGKCLPCREGCYRGQQIIQKIQQKQANQADYDNLNLLMEVMREMSLCALGQSFSTPVQTCMNLFPEDFTIAAEGGAQA